MIWLGTVVLNGGPACAKTACTNRLAMAIAGIHVNSSRLNDLWILFTHNAPHWRPGK